MLRGIAEDARVLAARRKIKVEIGTMEPAIVRGDATRLHQLFLNLIDNAVKYSEPHSTVTLSLRRVEGSVEVSVQDTGIGIPKKELSKIFNRFYRVNSDGSGSGLGLAIAKWIAEAHHGTIRVNSREKKGSTFIVTLPLAQASA
jgi:signal transduction histidine kinase